MAILNVKEDDSVRRAGISVNGKTAERKFTTLSDNAADGPVAARQATGIPRVGDQHPDDNQLYVQSVDAQQVGSSRVLFEVRIGYATPQGVGGGGGFEDPLDQPADVSWGNAVSVEPIDMDEDGNAITNSADEGFDPPITKEFADPVLTITRNQATFDASILPRFVNAVNSDTFFGEVAGRARIMDISAQRVMQGNNVIFWRVTYVIQFRRGIDLQGDGTGGPAKAWYRRILDEGFRKKIVPASGGACEWETFRDKNDVPLNNPVLLNGSGEPQNCADNPVWLEFRIYRSEPFAELALE